MNSESNELLVITGNESNDYGAQLNAVIAFYRAFNQRDLELMRANWLDSMESSLCNPLGGLKRGWDEIETVYRTLFQGEARVYVEYYDFQLTGDTDFFVIVGRERGEVQLGKNKLALKIRTSRFFRFVNERWQQIHHHGSIEDPELLANYQMIKHSNKVLFS